MGIGYWVVAIQYRKLSSAGRLYPIFNTQYFIQYPIPNIQYFTQQGETHARP